MLDLCSECDAPVVETFDYCPVENDLGVDGWLCWDCYCDWITGIYGIDLKQQIEDAKRQFARLVSGEL